MRPRSDVAPMRAPHVRMRLPEWLALLALAVGLFTLQPALLVAAILLALVALGLGWRGRKGLWK